MHLFLIAMSMEGKSTYTMRLYWRNMWVVCIWKIPFLIVDRAHKESFFLVVDRSGKSKISVYDLNLKGDGGESAIKEIGNNVYSPRFVMKIKDNLEKFPGIKKGKFFHIGKGVDTCHNFFRVFTNCEISLKRLSKPENVVLSLFGSVGRVHVRHHEWTKLIWLDVA